MKHFITVRKIFCSMRTKQLIQNDNFYIGGEGNTSAYLGTESITADGSGLYAWLCPSSSEGITVSLEVSAGVTARIEYTINSVQEIESDTAYWKAWDAGDVTALGHTCH
jgi:hypothetical protein